MKNKLDEAEDRISDLEDKVAESTQWEQQREKIKRKDSLMNIWENIKYANICIIGVPEREETE